MRSNFLFTCHLIYDNVSWKLVYRSSYWRFFLWDCDSQVYVWNELCDDEEALYRRVLNRCAVAVFLRVHTVHPHLIPASSLCSSGRNYPGRARGKWVIKFDHACRGAGQTEAPSTLITNHSLLADLHLLQPGTFQWDGNRDIINGG